jgi:tRNA nucleotidyltransferase (CCA-adding enzyme)
MNIFQVGGCVRDQYLNLPVTERDWVVVGATPELLESQGYRQVGKDFPVFLHPQTHEEYALARQERKMGTGYYGFETYFSPDVRLEEDLLRRDLTINAMAQDEAGVLIDPYGGLRDLKARILRHVSPAFVEDPLRVLRVARFAARFAYLGFRVAPETAALMQAMAASGELTALVAERVWKETHKALSERSPEVFFEVLRACGALKILFPELDQLYGVPNPPEHHPEIDSGIHTLMVLQAAVRLSLDPKVRFAALLHDLGKGLTPRPLWPKHHGHERKGVPLVKALCERFKIPQAYTRLAILTCDYHGLCHRATALRAETIYDLFRKLDAFRRPEDFELFLLACTADARGRTGFETVEYPQADYLRACFLATQGVSAEPFLDQGLSGEALAGALRKSKIAAIAELKPTLIRSPGR